MMSETSDGVTKGHFRWGFVLVDFPWMLSWKDRTTNGKSGPFETAESSERAVRDRALLEPSVTGLD